MNEQTNKQTALLTCVHACHHKWGEGSGGHDDDDDQHTQAFPSGTNTQTPSPTSPAAAGLQSRAPHPHACEESVATACTRRGSHPYCAMRAKGGGAPSSLGSSRRACGVGLDAGLAHANLRRRIHSCRPCVQHRWAHWHDFASITARMHHSSYASDRVHTSSASVAVGGVLVTHARCS